LASDHITVDGKSVGFMYREAPRDSIDSGWHFFSGEETQEYADKAENFAIYDVNTIANYDPSIISHLDAPLAALSDAAKMGRWFPRTCHVIRIPDESLERTREG